MNTVLASPPRNVMRDDGAAKVARGSCRVTTEKTGVYSVADMPTPRPTHTA